MPNLDYISPDAAVLCIETSHTSSYNDNNFNLEQYYSEKIRNNGLSSYGSTKSGTNSTCSSSQYTNSPKNSPKSSVQPSSIGPRAYFIRLPEIEILLPELSNLGGWIDRTR
jgi:hypothetical protein